MLGMTTEYSSGVSKCQQCNAPANANTDVGKGEIKFNINGKEEHFTFKPKPERDSTVKEVHEEEPLETPSPEEGNLED